MNLISPATIKELLSKYKTRPSKGLGQNFLIDKNVLGKIIETADIKSTDIVLEVGPGIGTLTQELAKRAGKVIAVEKDRIMCKTLKETLADHKNVEIIHGDILKIGNWELIENCKLKIENYKIVANIPYYITSLLIRKFLEAENKPKFMILMLQKEVAQRICALPQTQGKPRMSLLAVSVQFYAEPKIISYVSKNCFWPSPKVDSAIIKITPFRKIDDRQFCGNFFRVVKAGFSQPRKQLVNNLLSLNSTDGLKLKKEVVSSWLLENNIKPTQRAENLTINDWIKICATIK